MKRPAFQFYPADWRASVKLLRCSHAARGAWIDVLCLLHDADEYGVLRWPLAEIAQVSGAPIKLLRELVSKGVLKGADSGAETYIHRPSHAGKLGDPIVLVEPGIGPVWYSSRFVLDEWRREQRGKDTRFTSTNQPTNPPPNTSPTRPVGERLGDGPSSASAFASTQQYLSSGQAPASTEAGRACRLMRAAGCAKTNPAHPELLAALADGITPEALAEYARNAIGKQSPFAYAITAARSDHAQGVKTHVPADQRQQPQRLSLADQLQRDIDARDQPRRAALTGTATRVDP